MTTEGSEAPGHSTPYHGTYRRAFRMHVHQLLAWGHADGRRRIQTGKEDEPVVTSFIKEAIQERLRDPACPRWCYNYAVQENPPVEYEGRAGKSKVKPDMIIEGTFKGRPEYVFEAKRLRERGPDVRQYMGRKGIGCFVRGLYASRYDEAAMLGYVQSHSASHWREVLEEAMKRTAGGVALRSPQRGETVVEEFPDEWVSEHDRLSVGPPITLRHILLECRPSPVPNGSRADGISHRE